MPSSQLGDIGVQAIDAVFARNADLLALQIARQSRFPVRNRHIEAGRILGIEPGHGFQHDRAVAHVARHRPGLIERGGKGHNAPARAAAIGRLDAAMPVKAAGWRIEPPVSVPVAAGTMRAATAAEEPPEEPPGASAAVSFGRRQGEITLPKALLSLDEPMANWSRLSLPSMPAPASHSFCETVLS
jgi:hypothetical protein